MKAKNTDLAQLGSRWDPDMAITESDLVNANLYLSIKALRIEKSGGSFLLFAELMLASNPGEFYLATMRSDAKPREFRHLGRLIEYVERVCTSVDSLQITIRKSEPTAFPADRHLP